MHPLKRPLLAASLLLAASGCGGYARTPDQWVDDTTKLLEAQNESIKVCYNKALRGDPKLRGSVVVNFIVEDDTGRLRKARIDNSRTTAGEPLRRCVLDAMRDLKLTPADAAMGRASWTWEFNAVYVKEDGTPVDPSQIPPT